MSFKNDLNIKPSMFTFKTPSMTSLRYDLMTCIFYFSSSHFSVFSCCLVPGSCAMCLIRMSRGQGWPCPKRERHHMLPLLIWSKQGFCSKATSPSRKLVERQELQACSGMHTQGVQAVVCKRYAHKECKPLKFHPSRSRTRLQRAHTETPRRRLMRLWRGGMPETSSQVCMGGSQSH